MRWELGLCTRDASQITDVYKAQSMICAACCCLLLLMSVHQRTTNEPTPAMQQQQQVVVRLAFFDLMRIRPPKFTLGRRPSLSLNSNYSAWGRRFPSNRRRMLASREIYRTSERQVDTGRGLPEAAMHSADDRKWRCSRGNSRRQQVDTSQHADWCSPGNGWRSIPVAHLPPAVRQHRGISDGLSVTKPGCAYRTACNAPQNKLAQLSVFVIIASCAQVVFDSGMNLKYYTCQSTFDCSTVPYQTVARLSQREFVCKAWGSAHRPKFFYITFSNQDDLSSPDTEICVCRVKVLAD